MKSGRYACAAAIIFGLLASMDCFLGLSAEALPYQDSTAEMLALQSERIRSWWQGLAISLLTVAAGCFQLWRLRHKRG